MVFLAQSEPGIATMPSELDSDPWLLNVKNGTVYLKSGKLLPHNRGTPDNKACSGGLFA